MNSLSGKRVLITGAGGFIGSHLTEELVRSGASVRAFVRYNSRGSHGWLDRTEPGLAKQIEFVAGDVTDAGRVREALEGCDIVFHLAALIGIPYSYHAPESYVQTNVCGTMNVLNACRNQGVELLVHTSTSETYGTAQYVPIDEKHPLNAQSPYAATKTAADQLALSYHRSFDIPVTVIRPFNTFGPRQSLRAVIPTVLGQLLSGSKEIRAGSLHPTRDFNYVSNTVDGFVGVAEAKRESVIGETFNLGSGAEISIGDLMELCMKITSRRAKIVTETERVRPSKSEVERLLADASKATEAFGYRPKVSLEEGLRLMAEYLLENSPARTGETYAV